MNIKPNTQVTDIRKNEGFTAEQKATAVYFDKDNNGTIDANEASIFNSSNIKLNEDGIKISLQSGETHDFEDWAKRKENEFYESGTIPVAVIDVYSSDIPSAHHGNVIANQLKSLNPEMSLSRFNILPTYTPEQIALANRMENDAEFRKEIESDPEKLKQFIEATHQPSLPPYVSALSDVKKQMDEGKQFVAANLSSGVDMSYETLNTICAKELGATVTPDNIAEYKTQIKEILFKKVETGELSQIKEEYRGGGEEAKDIIAIIQGIEALGIPVFVPQAYKLDDFTTQGINLFSLAENAKTVEGGTNFNGEIQSPLSSTSSLAVDPETGERRLEDSFVFAAGEFGRNSTSYAVPIGLAKSLEKKQ